MTLDEINDRTGYAMGDRWNDADEVRAYFTPEAQRDIYGDEAETDAATLAQWAERVIDARSHMI